MTFIILNGFAVFPVMGLAGMQLFSVGKNFTTNEHIKSMHDMDEAYGDILQTLEFRNQRDAVNQSAPAGNLGAILFFFRGTECRAYFSYSDLAQSLVTGLGPLSSEMDQLLPTTKVHVQGAWNPYDKGVYRNCLDFWSSGYHGDDCVINSKEDLRRIAAHSKCCSARNNASCQHENGQNSTANNNDLESGLGNHRR